MVIKWSDSVNIREPWRKGHSIFAAPSRGAGGRVWGGCTAGSRSGTSGSALRAVVRHRRSAEGYAGALRRRRLHKDTRTENARAEMDDSGTLPSGHDGYERAARSHPLVSRLRGAEASEAFSIFPSSGVKFAAVFLLI